MGSKGFRTLKWVVFALSSLLLVPESQGSSFLSSLVTKRNFEPSPAISPELPSLPLSSPPEASKDVKKINFPSPASSPTLNSEPTNNQSSIPVNAPSKGVDKIISPAITPTPPEAKQTSNFSSGFSPSISPVSNKKAPSNAHAPSVSPPSTNPEPQKEKLNSTFALSPSPSSIESQNPSNSNTPAPFPSNSKPLAASPHISPTLHREDEPSNSTHSPSPSSIEAQNSSNANTIAPFPSNPKPLIASPQISPASHEANKPSNTTHSPLPTIPSPAKSPVSHEEANSSIITISPTSHEANKPSNTTHSPLRAIPSPAVSPVSNEEANSSIITHAPSTSNPKIFKLSPTLSPSTNTNSTIPLVSSPTISPTPHETIKPSNITHAPLASSISPAISSIPREVHTHSPKNSPPSLHISPSTSLPSNDTISPLPSHIHPSFSPPSLHISPSTSLPSNDTISPLPSHIHPSFSPPSLHISPSTSLPSNDTISPLPSHIHPSLSTPIASPTPHEVKQPSNITHVPLPSLSPIPLETSPAISPIPHLVKVPTNTTHVSNDTISPLPSHIHPSFSPPSLHISPSTSLPSNDTISPLPSHIHPSLSTPIASPTPHEVKQPSNFTHFPLPSLSPIPLETSPAISPIPHLVKVPTNTTHVSPLLSPMPHGLNNATSTTHEMAPIVSKPKHDALAPWPHSPQSSERQAAAIPPSRIPVVPPSSNESKHAPSPRMHVPSITPVEAPSNLHVPPKDNQMDHSPSPKSQDHSISPMQTPFPSPHREVAFAPSPSKVIPSWHNKSSVHHPVLPPRPQIIWALPPPPPNLDCKFLTCQENVTYPPPGSLCVCVMPIKVELRLGISLFTFFPLVTELAQEIASGVFVKQSQVRVMGANADAEDPGKTILLIDLVPLGKSFDINTALLVYARFWHKQVLIKDSYFGEYDVLYVDYPGLPPSPPVAQGYVSVDGGSLTNGNARAIKPIGVDVKKKKGKISGALIAIIILSSIIALVIIAGAAWILLLRCRNSYFQPSVSSHQSLLPLSKPSGSGPTMLGSGRSSTSASLTSSIVAGSAKTFCLAEMERATNNFHESRIIGEGGFGRVYQGTLEDGTLVAVKVLKRDDHQGGREFVAEIEMLSRLHHRNLVKLIGICVEEIRCLVYELIPNGSVESHLHGPDRTTSPLDWNARIKIALGAARGLAYLHEDSSPRVIHRDFKSSNILLEHDYTAKVSDFGLARVALGEGNDHISTCVMGTFGYVAPEYAMTGHLLVKSDVYSYGVVLLELLTGRKPVDMSQPPGQETLVNWARPLLTSTEGLEILIDPSISANVSFDTVAKVAAIASMCVQPEVSNRPYMGEVVQALKLVCDETDEDMRCFAREESFNKEILGVRNVSRELFGEHNASGSGSFRKGFSSGPIKMGRSENEWENVRQFSSGDQWH